MINDFDFWDIEKKWNREKLHCTVSCRKCMYSCQKNLQKVIFVVYTSLFRMFQIKTDKLYWYIWQVILK